jgi:pectate lyase
MAGGCATPDSDPDPTGAAGTMGQGGDARGGTTGAAGTTGVAGTTGSAGTTGAAGVSGVAGNNSSGVAGTTGSAGTTGRGGAAGGVAGAGGRGGAAGGAAGRGGAAGGAAGAAGRGGAAGGAAGRGGAAGAPTTANLCTWPTAAGSPQAVSATIAVSGTYDGGMKRFVGSGPLGGTGQDEGQDPLFEVANGGTLQNVIIGSPAADGVHCRGTCTLRNVWWEDVGEDAATLQGSSSSQTMTIENGGAKGAADKVFQHNGPGTMIIRNFCAQDFGKLYRSCGNCDSQFQRNVEMDNVMIIPRASALAGVNTNYNDTARFTRITIRASANSVSICDRYTGNNTGAEPTKTGSGADGKACIYSASDITWQ